MDVNKLHDDNKGGGEGKRMIISIFDKSQADIAYSILNYE